MPISNRHPRWFYEAAIPGSRADRVRHGFLIEKMIYQGTSPFQTIRIFKNPTYGKVLCLDDIVQFSQSDEFIYHEMIVHPLLFSHPRPEQILIIGGGDGGALREVLRHPVRAVDMVEIDARVIAVAKKHLQFVCRDAFSDKRLTLRHLPGQEFLRACRDRYDVIIVDCTNSDEGALSEALYGTRFFRAAAAALKTEGLIITLGSAFLDLKTSLKPLLKRMGGVFAFTAPIRFCMPSYHCGEYAFAAAAKTIDLEAVDFKKIQRRFAAMAKEKPFTYYTPDVHRASLTLPPSWRSALGRDRDGRP